MTNSNASARQRQGNTNNSNANTNNNANAGNLRSETTSTGTRVPLDVNKPEFQDKLFELNWYLGIANAVFKPVKKNINVKGSDGKIVSKEVEKNVFSHYEYSNVNGQSFPQWVKATFGEQYEVDNVANMVYSVGENQPTPQPQPESITEETQNQTDPSVNPNANPNDPENN